MSNMDGRALDDLDWQILKALQDDARIRKVDLAARVALSPPGLQKRLRRLETTGVIQRYATILAPQSVGFDLMCFVHVSLSRHAPATVAGFREGIVSIPEVLECHHVTGEEDYLVKAVVRNRMHLERLLLDKLTPLPGVGRFRTSVVLSETKQTTVLPLEPFAGGHGSEAAERGNGAG